MPSEKILAQKPTERVSDALAARIGFTVGAALAVQGASMWALEHYVRHVLLGFALLMTYLAVSLFTTNRR